MFCFYQPEFSAAEEEHLQEWAQMMPFRESFAWITIPLFDSAVTGGVGGFGAPFDGMGAYTPGTR